ncbi:MAG: BsaA family SipW-dependent biofilm matrix protein [Propionibacteriaceae bacterium]|nr:BsaA family SipW-dependent biofilm matrix protein [Propionibacteriaceae bacterium]
MKLSKPMTICVAGACAAVMAVSATYAWFTAQDSVTNHLETAQITDGTASIVEVFTPPTEWVPGQEVAKEVAVSNTGTGDVLARVSFEEVMKLLQQPVKGNAAAAAGTQIPQLYDPTAYLATPYATFPGTSGLTASGLPADVTLQYKASTVNGTTSYSFVPLHQISGGDYDQQYQRVTADFAVNGTVVTVSNVKYWAFDGTTTTEAAWAAFSAPKTSATAVNPPLTIGQIVNPITDLNKKIELGYADQANLAAPLADHWFYNQADGFFYYIGKVAPGSITADLLKTLKLDESADSSYAGMSFDLIVNLEAIQNTVAALTATDGWNLPAASPVVAALTPYCE